MLIHHDSRFVRIAGITSNPVTSWVTQQARNISMELAAQTNPVKFLIRDRDTKFTASFDALFAAEGTRVITTPVRAPPANAICERVIGTIRRECLDRMIILGRRHLQAVLAEYVEHYNVHHPTAPSANDRPPVPMRPLPPSATPTPPGYEEPMVWVASSTSTGWSPELGGRGSRHPHGPPRLCRSSLWSRWCTALASCSSTIPSVTSCLSRSRVRRPGAPVSASQRVSASSSSLAKPRDLVAAMAMDADSPASRRRALAPSE
ncbi:MAG: integrase core domain-containing protein [Actinomycetota bacterium]|nr:integrase core domain-containing protein [Actinomycetota bacterium]